MRPTVPLPLFAYRWMVVLLLHDRNCPTPAQVPGGVLRPTYVEICHFVKAMLSLSVQVAPYFKASDPNCYFMDDGAFELFKSKQDHELAVQRRLSGLKAEDSWAFSASRNACSSVCGLAVCVAVLRLSTSIAEVHLHNVLYEEAVRGLATKSPREDPASSESWVRFFKITSAARHETYYHSGEPSLCKSVPGFTPQGAS